MTTATSKHPCIRCGKERIVGGTWQEERKTLLGSTTIIHTEMICPDSDCQEVVVAELQAKEQARNEKLQRSAARKTQ